MVIEVMFCEFVTKHFGVWLKKNEGILSGLYVE